MSATPHLLPRVILIGDSIRMSYAPIVQRELLGVAAVWSPEQNCSSTVIVLNNLRQWALQQPADVIHINAGLHDLKTICWDMPPGQRESLVPLEFYRQNVRRILKLLQKRTKARIIWAATTPVHDENSRICRAKTGDFDRYDEDVCAYNAAAREVCRELNIVVNDLYAVVRSHGLEKIQSPDGVHFNAHGAQVLGLAVAESVKRELASV